MEKQGEIRPGNTPPEAEGNLGQDIGYAWRSMTKAGSGETVDEEVTELEEHATKRAADAVEDGLQ